MRAVLQAVDKSFAFIGAAQATAEIEHRIVIVQRQFTQKLFQFLKSVANLGGIAFVGLGIGLVELIQYSLAVTVNASR